MHRKKNLDRLLYRNVHLSLHSQLDTGAGDRPPVDNVAHYRRGSVFIEIVKTSLYEFIIIFVYHTKSYVVFFGLSIVQPVT